MTNLNAFFRICVLCCCVFPEILLCGSHDSEAAQFTLKNFQYEKMERKAVQDCDKSQAGILDLALQQVENNQSKEAVLSATKVYTTAGKCPRAHAVYAWCLFQSGEWLKAMETIDRAIEALGGYPDLVAARANMEMEMGNLGTNHKVVDGNGIYFPEGKGLPFDDEQFRKENFKAALNDILYLIKDHPERYAETAAAAYLYYMLENYGESNRLLEKLLDVKEYRDLALMGVSNNYIAMKQFAPAEKILIEMETKDPKEVSIQKQFVSLYTAMADDAKTLAHRKKLEFYSAVPPFTDLQYTEENYRLVTFFTSEENPVGEKKKKLDAILKGQDKGFATDICFTVLAMHPHGSGLEEVAVDALIRSGKDSVPKTIHLLHSPGLSTCTITFAADILATIKDERGWQPLVDCLPLMARLPSTLLPPQIPDMIVKFDRDRGLKALLTALRDMMRADQNGDASKDPAQTSEKAMVYFAFYSPLKSIDGKELTRLAKSYGYTESETRILLKNIADASKLDL